jgi:hypothetical protein
MRERMRGISPSLDLLSPLYRCGKTHLPPVPLVVMENASRLLGLKGLIG